MSRSSAMVDTFTTGYTFAVASPPVRVEAPAARRSTLPADGGNVTANATP